MKTGLVTFYHIHHYGALLQAYATEQAVERCGSECEIVDYYVNQNNDLFRKPTGLGSAAADVHTARHYGPLKARYQRFETFSKQYLRISGHRFESLEELKGTELPYDVILSGSERGQGQGKAQHERQGEREQAGRELIRFHRLHLLPRPCCRK